MTEEGTSSPDAAGAVAAPIGTWPKILTWRSDDGSLVESFRIQLSGRRIKAYGRIIGVGTPTSEAFNASLDLVTDDAGITKRLSIHLQTAARDTAIRIARDGEDRWLVTDEQGSTRGEFAGAKNVDVLKSAFFNALTIRAHDLQTHSEEVDVPVVYVDLPGLNVHEAVINYSSAADGVTVISPVSSSTLSVDSDGFVLDYPGLSKRV
ncbi:putative glycolipid-binding domain-containing protein [Tsukamurella soli]|uniref:Glycolipid-binding domain-containing protein n=1 Tax=Tsukamurella soli TaxID=644556 RepID=A0ABP8K8U0_9ACTN